MPGADAYATSKQCNLATVMAFAPRLRFSALEPGFTPDTGLGREANVFLRFLANYILPVLAPHIKYWSTPKKAARVATKVASGQTGIYYDDGGNPMLGSELVRESEVHSSRRRRDTRSARDGAVTRSVTPIDSPNYLAPSFPSYLSYHSNDQGA